MAQAVFQGVRGALGLVASPFVKMGTAYAAAAEKRPFTVGVVTTGLKTSAADLFAQMVRSRVDVCTHRRAAIYIYILCWFCLLPRWMACSCSVGVVWACGPSVCGLRPFSVVLS